MACGLLVVDPSLPGPFFYHPRMVALVHLLTLGWIGGSILGAFYIVAPLALRLPLPVSRHDGWAAGGYWLGASGIISHAWMGHYSGLAWSAPLVLWPVARLTWRVFRGLHMAVAPWPVLVHVVLAFVNMLAAGIYGAVIAWDRGRGVLVASPMAMAFAHAHLATVGWAVMLVVGLGYRLIPMILPGVMPTGASLVISAVLLHAGVWWVVWALTVASPALGFGALTIVAGLAAFVWHVRRVVSQRLPRPPALPARDWSTWLTHTAMIWMGTTIVAGLMLAWGAWPRHTVTLQWTYGVAGLLGFLATMIVGMQGRLVPLYAWYRAWALRPGPPPAVAANALPSAAWARPIFVAWAVGVPVCLVGLAGGYPIVVAAGAAVLGTGVVLNAAYLWWMVRRA